MAGFLVAPEGNPAGIQFHVGEPNLSERLHKANLRGRIMTLQLDCDELEAALWGLEQWNEPGPQVPLKKNLFAQEIIGVVTNAIGFSLYAHDGREVFLHEPTNSPKIVLSEKEANRCRWAAIHVLSHLQDYLKEI